jgi:peptidase E
LSKICEEEIYPKKEMKKQILAIGGGGFTMKPENLKLDRYLLSLSEKECPKVCFIGTASGDEKGYIDSFYDSYKKLNCETSHLALYNPPECNLRDFVLDKDIFYVGGGNTRNLLALWKEWRLDKYLKEAWLKGSVLAGISAGSICWFEQGLTDSVTGMLLPLECLGFLPESNCPHFDTEVDRRPVYHKTILDGSMKPGIACDDAVAAHYIDGKLRYFVSSLPNAKAYKIRVIDGNIKELIIDPTYLKYF